MTRGTVRWVSPRGSGFIRCEDNTDIFFCRPPAHGVDALFLKAGQLVEFEITRGFRGRHAERLALVK
jgi:cold shock CspA family protein